MQVIEGLSNEVVVVSVVVLGIIVTTSLLFLRRILGMQSVPGIHPDSEEVITVTRQRLPNRPPRENDSDTTCAICLGSVTYGLETNCGHLFCGNCIIMYWKSGRWLGAVACPICRQNVTILMLSFTSDELLEENSQEKNNVLDEVYSYNRRFSGEPRTVWEYIQDLPAILRHTAADLFSLDGMVVMFRVRIILFMLFALMYLFSPFDIIPDFAVGFLGFLDDIFIVLIVAIYISIIYRGVLAHRAENHARQT